MRFPGKNPVHKMAKAQAKKKAEPKSPAWLVALLQCPECGARLARTSTRDYVACVTPGHGKLILNDELEKLVVKEMWRIIEAQEAIEVVGAGELKIEKCSSTIAWADAIDPTTLLADGSVRNT